jgi:hypothetical protein
MLESFETGSGVTVIGESTFASCSSLKSLSIPPSVEFLSWRAFLHSENLWAIACGPEWTVTRLAGGRFPVILHNAQYAFSAALPESVEASGSLYVHDSFASSFSGWE